MCGGCGCHTPKGGNRIETMQAANDGEPAASVEIDPVLSLDVMQDILQDNNQAAMSNRERFHSADVVAINLMSSPGAGKTRLLEQTAEWIDPSLMAVIEGDMETENDAARIRAKGVQARQILTGTACHLEADMVQMAAKDLDLGPPSFLFIENVGNLICPANFDLGQRVNVVLLSVTEGDDKPAKYPAMFQAADLVLVTKTDLLPVMDEFDMGRALAHISDLRPDAKVIQISSKTGAGMLEWLAWLDDLKRHGKRDDAV